MLDIRNYPPGFGYVEVSSGTNTIQAALGAGILHSIVFNNVGTAWEVDVFDGVSSAAVFTEFNETATQPNPIAKIRSAAFGTVIYDIPFRQGVFLDVTKGTTQGDLTVVYTNAI